MQFLSYVEFFFLGIIIELLALIAVAFLMEIRAKQGKTDDVVTAFFWILAFAFFFLFVSFIGQIFMGWL
jgi:hypothetical protein